KVNIEEERKKFVSAGSIKIVEKAKRLKKIDTLDFFPFMLAVVLGNMLGVITIPGIDFSLGSAGGTLIMGLVIGHFGHMGNIDLSINKNTLNFFRELGLVLFLVGAGIPGGINFVNYVQPSYFIYGAILTLVPMFGGFFLGKYVFKLSIFNNLGSLTGGMTSTPALGTLIAVAKTDEVAAAYAATYPIALVMIVLAAKFIVILF
ncbi:MAG: permease, partial [Eubacteriales bacterium]